MKGRKTALAAACILLILTMRPDAAYGAPGIDTDRADCSIRFDLNSNYPVKTAPDVPEGTEGAGYPELAGGSVRVLLYKVADVDAGGRYREPAFGDTSLYQALEKDLADVNADTKAAQWLAMAETAAGKAAETENLVPAADREVTAQSPDIGGLTAGLYLVSAQDVVTEEYRYTFTPYLVSLPGYNASSDEWVYEEVPVGLKASQDPRYGELEIRKTLRTFNMSLGEASFIFRVEAVKDQKRVYSDVVSLTFDGADTRTRRISGRIPAGADVTVTEIYSGAGYEAYEGDGPKTVHISAYDPEHPESLGTAAFVNDYGGGLNTGTCVENQFTYEAPESEGGTGDWKWEPLRGAAGGSAGRE